MVDFFVDRNKTKKIYPFFDEVFIVLEYHQENLYQFLSNKSLEVSLGWVKRVFS